MNKREYPAKMSPIMQMRVGSVAVTTWIYDEL